jgi:hypothetical protein
MSKDPAAVALTDEEQRLFSYLRARPRAPLDEVIVEGDIMPTTILRLVEAGKLRIEDGDAPEKVVVAL